MNYSNLWTYLFQYNLLQNIFKYHHQSQVCTIYTEMSNSYIMGCPPERGDDPRALASGLSYVQVDKHGISILYHQHQYSPCTSRDIS